MEKAFSKMKDDHTKFSKQMANEWGVGENGEKLGSGFKEEAETGLQDTIGNGEKKSKGERKIEAYLGEEIPGVTDVEKNQLKPELDRLVSNFEERMKKNKNTDGAENQNLNAEKDASLYSPASKYFEEIEGIDKKESEKYSSKEKEKRRLELDSAVASSRMNFAKKNYESTNILSRLRKSLKIISHSEDLPENSDLFKEYEACVNNRLQFDIEELKSKNLSPEEFQEEADKLAKYYNQDEKANLYDAHNDARAKVWEEKFGKTPGWIAEKSGKFVNWYRKVNWKYKMGASVLAGVSGLGLVMGGMRMVGGAAAGVGIHGALESRYRGKEEERLKGEREGMMKNIEGIEGQEQKCEALMQMMQKEVGGFQKDLQRERKGALKRKLFSASVAAFIGSGKAAELVRGIAGSEYAKTAWVNIVGQKNADLFAEKFGELGQFLGRAKQVAGEKIHSAAEYAKGVFGSEAYAAGMPAAGISSFGSEFGEGVVPSHGADVVGHVPSGSGVPNNPEFPNDTFHADKDLRIPRTVPGSGVPNNPDFPNDTFHADKELRPPTGAPDNGMTQFEKDVRGSKLVRGAGSSGSGMTQFEQDVRGSSLGKGEMPAQHIEPVGKVSNRGMEKTYGHIEPVGKVSNEGFTNKILEIKKGSSIEHTMIKSGVDPKEAHRMVLAYAKEQGIPANKLDLVHPGAKLVLSPDGKHIINFQDSHQPVSKGQMHEQKTAKHASRPRAGHVEKAVTSQIPEESLNSGKTAGSLQENVPKGPASAEELKNQLATHRQINSINQQISQLDREITRVGNESNKQYDLIMEKQKLEMQRDSLIFGEKVETVKAIRQEIAGGKVEKWNEIQNQPAQEALKQKNSPVAVYYNYIVQENPGYVRYIHPRRYEPVIHWTARLADYHHTHYGRLANFNIPYSRRRW